MAMRLATLAVVLLAVLLTRVGEASPIGSCAAPATHKGTHCVCPTDQACFGGACEQGQGTGIELVHGYRPTCEDCYCAPSTKGDAVGAKADGISTKTATGPMANFYFLKLHKVGSTTVSIVLERLGEHYNRKLCLRGDAFEGSLPCQEGLTLVGAQVWTTHDVETYMLAGGMPALTSIMGEDAVSIIVLRDPTERLLSRYFYDIARGAMVTQSTKPTAHDFRDYLAENDIETIHYLNALDSTKHQTSAAMHTLGQFDVVGITEDLDRFLVVLAHKLNVRLEDVTYKSEKVVVGRPKFADLDAETQELLLAATQDDRLIYAHAKTLALAQQHEVPDFEAKLARFRALESKIDQGCTFSDTQSQDPAPAAAEPAAPTAAAAAPEAKTTKVQLKAGANVPVIETFPSASSYHESDTSKSYVVWGYWGRVGGRGQSMEFGRGSLELCKNEFCKKFRDKTRNEWHNDILNSFVHHKGKYDLIKVDYTADADGADGNEGQDSGSGAGDNTPAPESKLPAPVKSLMELIFDVQRLTDAVVEMELDIKRMPLGKLTHEQIRAGYQTLKDIEALIKARPHSDLLPCLSYPTTLSHHLSSPPSALCRLLRLALLVFCCHHANASSRQLMEASSEFYTRIPHSFGMRRPPVIATLGDVRTKLQLVEALDDIKAAMKIIEDKKQQGEPEAPEDRHYRSLDCDLRPVAPTSDEYKMVKKYLKNTHGATHRQYKLELMDLFAIDKDTGYKGGDNKRLLWHGSRLTNWGGILSQGLRIAPPEAPVTGYMFGKGIYFADSSSKSANYCHTSRSNNVGLLMLSEVALGTCDERADADSFLPRTLKARAGGGEHAQPRLLASMGRTNKVTLTVNYPGPEGVIWVGDNVAGAIHFQNKKACTITDVRASLRSIARAHGSRRLAAGKHDFHFSLPVQLHDLPSTTLCARKTCAVVHYVDVELTFESHSLFALTARSKVVRRSFVFNVASSYSGPWPIPMLGDAVAPTRVRTGTIRHTDLGHWRLNIDRPQALVRDQDNVFNVVLDLSRCPPDVAVDQVTCLHGACVTRLDGNGALKRTERKHLKVGSPPLEAATDVVVQNCVTITYEYALMVLYEHQVRVESRKPIQCHAYRRPGLQMDQLNPWMNNIHSAPPPMIMQPFPMHPMPASPAPSAPPATASAPSEEDEEAFASSTAYSSTHASSAAPVDATAPALPGYDDALHDTAVLPSYTAAAAAATAESLVPKVVESES
ncbi:uncharacterized protein MONBRDRAFT_27847 [Monosiga brevicollis MX1]|uniref:Poly [ADP-ribose] polymerase n=1 Tax=Monosiga brevicollis TaxID=81824 RepID=A9V6M7_MONBE|nr:uncharacterized protein MONBRDRAFT_27847 [Monosiga brevicollis MX1]EDQ86760.1 predicted protein [Monosiga brevicollis MX1]|eukprot:XP_001748305.1 hypothetical protein [Monosiga brevicollis MX1]